MLVKNLMTKNVTSCHPRNNLAELAEVMWNQRCGALPIVDDSGRVMGILRIEISVSRLERETSEHLRCLLAMSRLMGARAAVPRTM